MSKDKQHCHCADENTGNKCECEDFEDELIFLYCSKCHRRVTVAEEGKKELDVTCCGQKMINLSELPSNAGSIFECKKCGAKICVEEDCLCAADGKECKFTCCSEDMVLAGSIISEDDSCGCGCGCDDDSCSCSSSDETFLHCNVCSSLVSVIKPCTCKDGCSIKCCGEKMTDVSELPDNSGKYYECKECGMEIFIDSDSMFKDKSSYKDVICDGSPFVFNGKTEEDSDPMEMEEEAPAYFCPICERLVFVSKNDKKCTPKFICCDKEMLDINNIEEHDGDLFECNKCGLKLIIEDDCLCSQSGSPCELTCCGTAMTLVKDLK